MPRMRRVSSQAKRFDSDADALPFPEGGVFGKRSMHATTGATIIDAAADAEMTIERIQRQFDALRRQVEQAAFHLPRDLSWRPPAA